MSTQIDVDALRTYFFQRMRDIEESHRSQVTELKRVFREELDRLQSGKPSSLPAASSSSSSSSSSSGDRRGPRPKQRTAEPRAPKANLKKKGEKKPSPAPAEMTPERMMRKIYHSKVKLEQQNIEFLRDHLIKIGSSQENVTAFIVTLHSIASRTTFRRRRAAIFAALCAALHKEVAPNKIKFRSGLLVRCQEEFNSPVTPLPEQPTAEDQKKRAFERNRKLGNASFVAHLVKQGLLEDTLMLRESVLPMLKSPDLDPIRLECCCRVVRILGPTLDEEKTKQILDPIYEVFQALHASKFSDSVSLNRIIEFRASGWTLPPREAAPDAPAAAAAASSAPADASSSSSAAPAANGGGKPARAPRKPRANVDDGDQQAMRSEGADQGQEDDQEKAPRKKRNYKRAQKKADEPASAADEGAPAPAAADAAPAASESK